MKLKLFIFIFILRAVFCFAQEKQTVAVLDFNGVGTDAQTVKAVEENLTTFIIQDGKYQVVERSQLNKVLNELNLSNSDDFNDQNAAEIGELLGAKLVLIGSVIQIDNKISINIRGIDVETGRALFAERKTTTRSSLVSAVREIAKILSGENIQFKKQRTAGIALTATGGTLLLAGIPLMIYTFAGYGQQTLLPLKAQRENFEISYSDYYQAQMIFYGLFAGSLSSIIIGTALTAAGIPLILYKKDKKEMSFKMDIQQSVRFYLAYQF